MADNISNNSKQNNSSSGKNFKSKKNYKNNPQKKANKAVSASEDSDSQESQNRKNKSRNRRPKTLTPARILQKFDNLLEQHLVARKKFFEVHGRFVGKQLEKVEQNYHKTMKALYEYKDGLQKDWQKEVLAPKTDLYPEDRQFTSTHNLEPIGDIVPFEGEFEDPHLLPTQKSTNWAEDTEESEGTIEDYNSYKGK